MKKISVLLILLTTLVLANCGGSGSSPTPPPPGTKNMLVKWKQENYKSDYIYSYSVNGQLWINFSDFSCDSSGNCSVKLVGLPPGGTYSLVVTVTSGNDSKGSTPYPFTTPS